MRRQLFATLMLVVACTGRARAHFVFVVPDADGNSARVILSETLAADAGVDVTLAGQTKLVMRGVDGDEIPLALTRGGDAYTVLMPGGGTRVVRGVADLGVAKRGKAHRLVYFPKTILGDAFDPRTVLGGATPVELVPVGTPGAMRLELRIDGKVRADAEVTVLLPDATEQRVKTDNDGRTPVLTQTGRYGAWARSWQDTRGEHDGEAFEQVRHYATLVFEAAASTPRAALRTERGTGPHTPAGNTAAPVRLYTSMLPEETSSFGAVAVDGWLYVYGGHTAPTHVYSTTAVSGRFFRLDLTDGRTWEELPSGPGLQGMNLAAHGGRVLRIGGMQPRNSPGQPAENWSVADCAGYHPASRSWMPLPPLPEPRSSHDVVVAGDTLVVVGGWRLRGGEAPIWCDSVLTLDLADPQAGWTSEPQPFRRRALIAAVHEGKVFVLGGFDENDKPSRRVDVFELRSGAWSAGPGLLGPTMNGFGPAACVHEGTLYVSVGDGSLLRLNDGENLWEVATRTTPRMVHRLVAAGPSILVLGGAAEGANFDLIESVAVGRQAATIPALASRKPAEGPVAARREGGSGTGHAFAVAAGGSSVQMFCPVMPSEPVDADSLTAVYRGQTIRLCCPGCVTKWNADPERYADPKILPQLADAGEHGR